MKKLNSIYLRRYNKIVLNDSTNIEDNSDLINATLGNIADLGYTLSGEIVNTMSNINESQIVDLYSFLENNLEGLVGGNVKHVPLFKNFPNGVPDHNEYLFERMIGFMESDQGINDSKPEYQVLSCGHAINTNVFDMSDYGACPICQKHITDETPEKELPALNEITPLKIIDLGSKKELNSIFTNLLSSQTSLSQQDKEDVETFFEVIYESGKNISNIIPDEIPLKENVAFIVTMYDKFYNDISVVEKYAKTSTDVLRMITALSGGDISLKDNSLFKNFKRKDRKMFLSVLDKFNCSEDMLKYKNRWIKLGEKLHPGDYSTRFKNIYKSFQDLRENVKIHTFASKVDLAFKSKDWRQASVLLSTRPTEFTRKIDLLLQHSNESDDIISLFVKVVGDVPTRVLIQVKEHFKHRTSKQKVRSFFPKGNVAKVQVIEDKRDLLSKEICNMVISIIDQSLEKKFAELKTLGKVYINPTLKDYIVPFSQRSATKSLNTITRGSKIDLPKDKFIRMFTHWMEGSNTGTVDVDLSAGFYTSDWEYMSNVSYTNISNGFCKHSGDLQSAPTPKGASEFIDINIEKAKSADVRYVVMNVFDFSRKGFVNFPVCFAGIMGRNDKTGKQFEAKTVKQRFDVTSDSQACIPLIMDLETMKLIWCDISLSNSAMFNNIESSKNNVILMGKAMIDLHKANLYDLFLNHAKARGVIVEQKKDADTIFDIDSGDYTPDKIDKIMSEFL